MPTFAECAVQAVYVGYRADARDHRVHDVRVFRTSQSELPDNGKHALQGVLDAVVDILDERFPQSHIAPHPLRLQQLRRRDVARNARDADRLIRLVDDRRLDHLEPAFPVTNRLLSVIAQLDTRAHTLKVFYGRIESNLLREKCRKQSCPAYPRAAFPSAGRTGD